MAERLKKQIVEQDKSVDLVCGPDAYRDLPRMLALTEGGQAAGRTIYRDAIFPDFSGIPDFHKSKLSIKNL